MDALSFIWGKVLEIPGWESLRPHYKYVASSGSFDLRSSRKLLSRGAQDDTEEGFSNAGLKGLLHPVVYLYRNTIESLTGPELWPCGGRDARNRQRRC